MTNQMQHAPTSSGKQNVTADLARAVWQHKQRTLLTLLLLVLAKVTAVLVPLLLKAIVDRFSNPASMATQVHPQTTLPLHIDTVLVVPAFLLLGYALLRFAGTLFTELRDLVFARVTQGVVASYAERAFAHLLSLNPRFHTQRNTGALIREIERGTGGIGFLLGAGLFTMLPTIVEFLSVLVVMALGYSGWFTLVIVATFLVYAAYTTFMTQKRTLKQRRLNELDSSAHGRMVDGLLNYETVKTYAREAFEQRRYAAMLGQWMEHSVNNQKALSALHVGQSAIIAAGVSVVMLLAGEQTLRGELTVGDLVLVNAYVIQICLPLNTLGFVFREARDALVNTEKLLHLLTQRPEIEDRPGHPDLVVKGAEVVFDHVDFAYEPGRPILQDVSFKIGANQTIAVVGGSGSGKSTLARLLLRLYDTGSGRILIDGQDVRGVRMASLRDAIGVVPQDTPLFNDTIAYNIGYGRINAGMAEVIEAAKAAQVHEFIMSLPAQYDTLVGERGTKLSGGERQRIAIARAFLKNPPIMIFDEATSALDTRAERAIQNELDRIAQNRSALVIAHRLSTVVNADLIIVMDKGRILEQGRHDELLRLNGLYTQLWNLQLQQQQFERMERRMARQPVNMAVLLAGVIDGLRDTLDRRNIRLYTDIDRDSARVSADPSTLGQVLHDVCAWALMSTPPGGRIELKLERHEGHVRLAVTDGRHLDEHQAARATPPREQDAGVPPLDPLEIRSTVERQGGVFHVEQPSATHGMRHVIEMPLHAIAPHEAQAGDPGHTTEAASRLAAMPDHPLTGMQVMCVDDLADAREALAMLLEQEGANVQAFSTATQTMDWLEKHPGSMWPKAIVCDIALGEEDGHELMRQIRQLEVQRHVPLEHRVPAIALSGFAGAGDRMRSMMSGFQSHLAKPADPRELVHAIWSLTHNEHAASAT
jgi:ATP-binding cassette subfamily B protein